MFADPVREDNGSCTQFEQYVSVTTIIIVAVAVAHVKEHKVQVIAQ